MRKLWLVFLLLLSDCVSVKSVDGTCSASTFALLNSATASCSNINGVMTGSTTGLDIQQLAAMVANYESGGAIPMPQPTPKAKQESF